MIHSKDYVTNLDEKCIQPNAVDLRLDSLRRLDHRNCNIISLTETGKEFFPREEVAPVVRSDGEEVYQIGRGIYEFTTRHEVEIPEGTAGWMLIRSTLARNGFLLGNGLYDAGYKGVIGGVLHVPGWANITTNFRVAQFIMASAETGELYDGHYNRTRGLSTKND